MNLILPHKGLWTMEKWSEKVFGKRRLLDRYIFPNGLTDVGIESLYDTGFHNGTKYHPWYIGLISNASFSNLLPTDTMASHATWLEFGGYDTIAPSSILRVEWDEDLPDNRAITNTNPALFDITGAGTLRGAFLVNDNGKGGTTGILFSTAVSTALIPVEGGEQIRAFYTLSSPTN